MSDAPLASFTAARNTCKLCAPLGACLAFRGIEGAVPLLHGSQGCATYIRRYLISHFKEPMDIASSNFGEAAAVYGGRDNLSTAIKNVIRQYNPSLVGIATTCLAETIGDDVKLYLRGIREELGPNAPELVHVSTPSYRDTHAEGFQETVKAIVESLCTSADEHDGVNLLGGMLSPADLRHLKDTFADFHIEPVLLPDYSETLDAPAWEEYQVLSEGGTPLQAIRGMGGSRATIEFSATAHGTAGECLSERFAVPLYRMPMPIGVEASDTFFSTLARLSGRPVPKRYQEQRGRLIDSYVDCHKYVFGKRAILYGEPELVFSLAGMLREIGMTAVLCATGSKCKGLAETLRLGSDGGEVRFLDDADFAEIEEAAAAVPADLVLGSSKGYRLARKLGIPMVRVGFPIHDRIDGPRLEHIGYRGTQQLFDRITNALLEAAQDASPIGYSYM